MMTSSNGNIFRVTRHLCGEFTGPGEFPTQRPGTRSFDVFFDLRLNKRLSKPLWGWWFETPSWSLWRQCNASKVINNFCHLGVNNAISYTNAIIVLWENQNLKKLSFIFRPCTSMYIWCLHVISFIAIIYKEPSCYHSVFFLRGEQWVIFSVSSKPLCRWYVRWYIWDPLLTWINLNPSMDN